MITFTADNHLGIEAQWAIKERREDFLRAFTDVADIAGNTMSKAVIVGGDLFDSPHPPSFAVEHAQNEVRRLASRGIQTFGIDGNHDLSDGKWLKVCGITPLTDTPVAIDGHSVCGISYRRATEVLSSLEGMVDRGVKCDILVLHLAFGELNRMGAASDLSSKELLPVLKKLGTRLVLMGHIHIFQSVEIDGITFAYCGSSETCAISEPREKKVLMVWEDLTTSSEPVQCREISSIVIGNEKEFATYADSLGAGIEALQSVFIAADVTDGVKRLRELAREHQLMMRIQVLASAEAKNIQELDRTTGVIGLEQAIGMSFAEGSEESSLIKDILRSPESMKMTVDKYMKGNDNNKEDKNDQ